MNKGRFAKENINVVLLEGIHQSGADFFRKEGYRNVLTYSEALEGERLFDALKEAHIVGIRSRTQLTQEVLAHAPELLAVGCFCIGTNQVDTIAMQQKAIPVFNAPYSNTRSVAELVIAEAIMLMRGIPRKNMLCHRGLWQKSAHDAYEVRGKTIGIVGYGHIGTQVGILAENLGMNVIFYDIVSKLSLGNAHSVDSLEALLARSDIVTLHVPEDHSTRNMLDSKQLAIMKKGAMLINAARGSIVDLNALSDLIHSGHLAGAAIDVFPVEPKANEEEFVSPLRGLDNVLLTPHIGGSTVEAQQNIAGEVASKLSRYVENGSTVSAVNFPEVSLPIQHPQSHRFLHVHANVPGIMKTINSIISSYHINITSQFLQTSGEVGYVVFDIESDLNEAAALYEEMKGIDGTIRCRMLI